MAPSFDIVFEIRQKRFYRRKRVGNFHFSNMPVIAFTGLVVIP